MERKGIIKINVFVLVFFIVLFVVIGNVLLKNKKNQENYIEEKNGNSRVQKEKVLFKVNEINCKKDDIIEVKVELQEKIECVAANFDFSYDLSTMQYEGYEVGESLQKGLMTLVNNNEDNQKVLIGYVGNPETENKEIEAGEFITLKFKIKEAGPKKIETKFNCSTLKKENGEDIAFEIKQATIEIE